MECLIFNKKTLTIKKTKKCLSENSDKGGEEIQDAMRRGEKKQ